jgi:hypothetical protein
VYNKRLTPVPLNPDPNFVKNLQQQCGDEKRIPSRCDRFLYHLGSGKQIDVNYQKGGPLVFASDHNAMWACLELYDGADSDKVGLNDEEIGSVLNSGNNDRTPANFENNTKIGGHARRRWTRRSSRF